MPHFGILTKKAKIILNYKYVYFLYKKYLAFYKKKYQNNIYKIFQLSSPIIPILSRINPIPHIDSYFFKVHSNIVLPSTPRPS